MYICTVVQVFYAPKPDDEGPTYIYFEGQNLTFLVDNL